MGKVKLTDICSPKQWKTIPTEQLTEDGYPVYGANGIIGKYSEYNHANPVIAITCRGATCGNINITQEKAYVTGNAMCLDDLCSDVDLEYLFYALRHYDFSTVISGSAQPQITRQGLSKVSVQLFPVDHQKFIAQTLAKAERIISHRRAQLAKLDELVKCRFVELFNCRMQADCNKILGDYAEVTGGFAFKSEKFEAEGVPIIRIGNIINNRVNLDEVVCYPEDFWEENSAYRVNCGDILMAMSGATTGKIGFCNSNSKLLLNQRVARIRTKPLFNYTAFLRAALEQDWMAEHILKTAYGCAQPNISAAEIRQLPMPDTTIESVQCFTSFIQHIDKLRFV